jgi:hypothetical protein
MKMRRNKIIFAVVLALVLTATAGFYLTRESSSASDLDYFKGNWTVTLRNNPKISFSWTVNEDLDKSWLGGVVTRDRTKISTDFWRQNGKRIERFAFTSGSTFVKIESAGWNGNQMVFNGTMSDNANETKVRETITKINDRQFNALWEREDAGGKWVVFGDEICTK